MGRCTRMRFFSTRGKYQHNKPDIFRQVGTDLRRVCRTKFSEISENSPKSRRIRIEVNSSLFTFRLNYHDDSSVNFFQRALLHVVARFLLSISRVNHSIWRTKMLKTFFAVSVATLLSATSGMAQSVAMKACGGDVKSLCAGIQPGDGRVKACIKSHFSDVSAPCQAVLVKAAAISKACSADVKKVCANVKPGGGRIEACMKSHLSELSDPCKDAVSQATAGKS
jgi:hypothetical protein